MKLRILNYQGAFDGEAHFLDDLAARFSNHFIDGRGLHIFDEVGKCDAEPIPRWLMALAFIRVGNPNSSLFHPD